MTARAKIPSGITYLKMVARLEATTNTQSLKDFNDSNPDYELIGVALSALYQAATCHRKCHGGLHILESLCGRIHNLALGAYLLAQRGLYDEALNLIRSIGEVSNLIALSTVEKTAIREWLSCDKRTRLSKFSPSKVRKALERQEPGLVLASEDWYGRFCEAYTHVTPQTRPNMHNSHGQSYVGGVYQAEGLNKTLGELATILGGVAMIVCKYFKFSDLFQEITAILKTADERSKADGN